MPRAKRIAAATEAADPISLNDYLRGFADIGTRRSALNEEASGLRRQMGGRPRQWAAKTFKGLTAKLIAGSWEENEVREAIEVLREDGFDWLDSHGQTVTNPDAQGWAEPEAPATIQ